RGGSLHRDGAYVLALPGREGRIARIRPWARVDTTRMDGPTRVLSQPIMTSPARTTVTAALPYANGPLHIGHIAGAYLPADIYVRNLKARGKEVLFVCGSDEHGAAITLRALKESTTPQAIVDKYHAMMGKAFAEFGIAFDVYHRTSSELHKQTSQAF